MFKKFREYPLTPAQYRKANRVVALAMTLSYIVFLAFAVVKDPVFEGIVKPPVIAYLVAILAVTALYAQKHIREKKAMLVLVAAYAWAYGSMAIMYDATFLPIVFPVFLALCVYLNEKLIAIGSSTFMIILLAKVYGVVQHGRNITEVGICNTVFVGIIFIMVVGIRAIGVLIDFSNDASAKIASKAAKQLEVAHQVETIVNELDDSFHELVDELTVINYSIDSTNNVMDQIATGSENTAEETVRQAMMTSEIQNRLKETSEIATDAKVTTDDLKAVIVNGKAQSDELSRQSQLVDDNTVEISKTVDHLVSNVSRVSDITDTILNISSQTNLLALNASIEAARAGEAGKGFAVVADEIRKLAEETKTSTEKITEIVNELIAVTNETQHGLQASVESINLQRESVKEVTGSFAAIEQGMASLYGGMNSVNEQVGAVLDANQTIVDGISTLSGISEEISAETATSRTNMGSLVDSMHKFSKVVESAFSSLQTLKETAAVEEEVEED